MTLTPKPFQLTAVDFALKRQASYLALDMGLGKSVVAALIHNHLNSATLVISPPSLVLNLEYEFTRWCRRPLRVSRAPFFPMQFPCIWIVPDSLIARADVQKEIQDFAVYHHARARTLIVDEAHRFKTPDSQRSLALFGIITPLFGTKVALSGSPIPNRPLELFPILDSWAPHTINNMSVWDYGRAFCDGFQDERGHWDFSGASNLKELGKRVIGPFMLRMKKADVMPELPPKMESLVFIGEGPPKEIGRLDAKILRHYSPEDLARIDITQDLNLDDGETLELSTYRRLLGEKKAPACAAYIKAALENTDEAVFVFAIHRSTVSYIQKALDEFSPLVVTGETPMKTRHELVKRFQTTAKHRVFIGNMAAAIGITLTKASTIFVAESPWVPGDLDQAIDRIHRIGTTHDTIFIRHLVFRDSLDRAVLETVLKKRAVIDEVMG